MQKEYEVILELSNKYSINALCKEMCINRSGFYKWLGRRNKPSQKEINRNSACELFEYYNQKFPSHGYRWLNAKIRLDLGVVYSNNFAHKICKFLNIKSASKHFKRYGKKANRELKNFPNYILAELNPLRPFQLIVTDMTAFWANKNYYELTLYMDLFNNEIVSYYLSNRKGDPSSYLIGMSKLIEEKNKKYMDLEMILHSDQGSVYCSKRFNESLYLYNITHSTSKPGTPTENGAMEAINGWVKEELFIDFKINDSNDIHKSINDYIYYFNHERPQCALNYLTPTQFKEINYIK